MMARQPLRGPARPCLSGVQPSLASQLPKAIAPYGQSSRCSGPFEAGQGGLEST